MRGGKGRRERGHEGAWGTSKAPAAAPPLQKSWIRHCGPSKTFLEILVRWVWNDRIKNRQLSIQIRFGRLQVNVAKDPFLINDNNVKRSIAKVYVRNKNWIRVDTQNDLHEALLTIYSPNFFGNVGVQNLRRAQTALKSMDLTRLTR